MPTCGTTVDLRDTIEAWVALQRPDPSDQRPPCTLARQSHRRDPHPFLCAGRYPLAPLLTPIRCDGATAVVTAEWVELYFDPAKVGRRAVETGVAGLQSATLVITGRQVEPMFSDGLTRMVSIPAKRRSTGGSVLGYETVDFIEELGMQTFYPIDELVAAGNLDSDPLVDAIVHMHTFVAGTAYKCSPSSCAPYAVLLRRGSPVPAIATSATSGVTLGRTSRFGSAPGLVPPTFKSGRIGRTITQAFIWNGTAWDDYPLSKLRRLR